MKKWILPLMLLSFCFTAQSQWSLTGNAATNPATNFLGTTDNKPLRFRVVNKFAGEIDSATTKTFIGFGAGKNTTSASNNVAIGYKSLFLNLQGFSNTAVGALALYSNNIWDNTAVGYAALYSNTSGGPNTAVGHSALYFNTTGWNNTAMGSQSLYYNNTGVYNTAIGRDALLFNTTGQQNTAIGVGAGSGNSTGYYNTAVGVYALSRTTISQYNTAVGFHSGILYDMGNSNTLIGANSDVSADGLQNCIAVGQAATCTASNQARIGNSATTSIGGYANWTNISDKRYKKDIAENVPGLDFIMRLRPITYHLDISGLNNKLNERRGTETGVATRMVIGDKEKILFTGFAGQEVEQAAKEAGYDFSGVDKPKNENDLYGLRYAEFVVPLVKAVQEQQQMIDELKKQNTDLIKRLLDLEKKAGTTLIAKSETK